MFKKLFNKLFSGRNKEDSSVNEMDNVSTSMDSNIYDDNPGKVEQVDGLIGITENQKDNVNYYVDEIVDIIINNDIDDIINDENIDVIINNIENLFRNLLRPEEYTNMFENEYIDIGKIIVNNLSHYVYTDIENIDKTIDTIYSDIIGHIPNNIRNKYYDTNIKFVSNFHKTIVVIKDRIQ
ncbi:hypothetical protein FPHOBKDP_00076 [Listeria phage LPJP1]|nr:hypothetical protein FPHOBKDP_00076 [Listeria phage LPJP1]